MRIILPRAVTKKHIHTAAACFIASKCSNVSEVVSLPEENQATNIDSSEVSHVISNSFDKTYRRIMTLCRETGVCDPIIEDSKDALEAIERVAKAIKDSYEYYLKKNAA